MVISVCLSVYIRRWVDRNASESEGRLVGGQEVDAHLLTWEAKKGRGLLSRSH
jgi:hypothetical protein